VLLGLGLGLEAKIFGLVLGLKVGLGLAARGLGLATLGLGLAPCGLVNITASMCDSGHSRPCST